MTTTIRGELVAGRVKMLENVAIARPPPVTLCSYRPPVLNVQLRYVQSSTKNNNGLKLPLRPAPATPQQPPSSATPPSAQSAAATAEAAEPLLPTHDNLPASKKATYPRRVTAYNMTPCRVLPPLDSARAKEQTKTPAPLQEVSYTLRGLPPTPPSTMPWAEFGDYLSALASRIQSSSPVTVIRGNLSTVSERLEKTIPTKRIEFKLSLLLLGCLLFLVVCRVVRSNDSELDDYFHNLNYSPDQLLVYRGETLKAVPKEGMLNENNCIVIERRRQTVSNGRSEVGVVASNEHRTFPGALLLANGHLVDNSPDVLAVGRAPLTYTVNLPGLTTDGSFTIVPSFSEYQAAVNEVLNSWFGDYPSGQPTAANFHSVESFAHTKHLLRVKFGLDFIGSVIETGIDFDAMARGEKMIKIYKFTQVFYTVSVEPTKRPSDLFDSSVTLNEIKQKTYEKNPPVLVDSVSYGRNIYVKIETTSIEKQAELNLDFLDDEAGLRKADELKDINIQIYVVGGHTNHTELINAKDSNEVHDIISKFSQFSKYNLGFPISYSSQFIKDNQKAIVHLSTDYVEAVRHDTCRKSVIKLIQRRWFCKWEVTWTEYSYDEDGNKAARERGWDKNSRVIKLPFESEDIEIPSYVEDLRVVARVHTLIDSWRTVIDRSNILMIPRREFYIYGDSSNEVRPPIAK